MVTPYIILGKITQTRGIQGQLVAQLTLPIQSLDPVSFIFIQIGHTYVPYQIEKKMLLKPHQAWLTLQDINTRHDSYPIVGKSIWLPKDVFNKIIVKKPTIPDQVIGYPVTDLTLGELGVVKRIEEFSMHRCLVVNYQNKELLIPYASTLIQDVDHRHKRLITDLPAGFLEAVGLEVRFCAQCPHSAPL
jgi:16S rRNA processing protein RimM